jgi:hypothetical protein
MSAAEVKKKASRPSSEAVFAVSTVVLALIFLFAINNQPWIEARTSDAMGTGFVPRLGVYIAIAGGLVLLLEIWRLPASAAGRSVVEQGRLRDFTYPAIVAATYVYGVYNIGFVVVTAIMLPGYLYASGIRRMKVLVPVSVVATLLMYIFFIRMLTLFFPRARFF